MAQNDNKPGAAAPTPTGSDTGGSVQAPPAQQQQTPPPVQQTPPPTAATKEEMVTVPKGVLEEVLAGQKRMEEALDVKTKEIERLTYAADRSRLGIFDQRNNGGQLIRKMSVGVWEEPDGKGGQISSIVRGWKMVRDEVNLEDNGGIRRLVEIQTIRLFLDQGVDKATGKENPFKEVDVEYIRFYRQVKRTTGEVVKESRDENGEYRTLRLEDGRTIDMDIRFVNI